MNLVKNLSQDVIVLAISRILPEGHSFVVVRKTRTHAAEEDELKFDRSESIESHMIPVKTI